MSKSLEFLKTCLSDSTFQQLSNRDWSKAEEFPNTEGFFDRFIQGERAFESVEFDENDKPRFFNVELYFKDDVEFNCFSFASSIHDCTLLFEFGTVENCMQNFLSGRIYGKDISLPKSNIRYAVGNFVLLDEYNGTWVPKDKIFLKSRTTVFLPAKIERID